MGRRSWKLSAIKADWGLTGVQHRVQHRAMPTPNFNFRLSADKAAALREMAKLYGSPNTSEFLREMVGAMCSGKVEQVKAFNGKLFQRIGEQLTLTLNATLETPPPVVPVVAVSAKKGPVKRRKGGKPRGRTK